MLASKGIKNTVYYNPIEYVDKTRKSSGEHKANVLQELIDEGMTIGIHFDDDPIQLKVIEERNLPIQLVYLKHNLTKK